MLKDSERKQSVAAQSCLILCDPMDGTLVPQNRTKENIASCYCSSSALTKYITLYKTSNPLVPHFFSHLKYNSRVR